MVSDSLSTHPGKTINEQLLALREQLRLARSVDRPKFARELDRLFGRKAPGADLERATASLRNAIEKSVAQVERLKALPLQLNFDTDLPITAHRGEIADAMAAHQVVVVCGATRFRQDHAAAEDLPRGGPRRSRIDRPHAATSHRGTGALQIGWPPSSARVSAVQWVTRCASPIAPGRTRCVKLMTDGILLRELENDRQLRHYDTLIIDEAHERSLNIDFLFGVLKRVLPQRPDLRVIITSATIDRSASPTSSTARRSSKYPAVVIPVEVRYRPLSGDEEDSELSMPDGIVHAVRELIARGAATSWCFCPARSRSATLPTRLARRELHAHGSPAAVLATVDSRSGEDFREARTRRIVLATNVAETSLTVPGIRYVIDSGLARISRYSVRGKVQRLPIEPISQASADQRKGRCGRESEGICIRLYAEDDFIRTRRRLHRRKSCARIWRA